jgi:hypothetical protein
MPHWLCAEMQSLSWLTQRMVECCQFSCLCTDPRGHFHSKGSEGQIMGLEEEPNTCQRNDIGLKDVLPIIVNTSGWMGWGGVSG